MQLVNYVDRMSLFHKLDPRVKVVWFAVLTILALAFRTLPVMIVIVSSLGLIWAVSGVHREMIQLLRKAIPLLVIAFVTWVIFGALTPTPGVVVLARWGPFRLEMVDILKSITVTIYILVTIGLFYTVVLTTDFSELADGLTRMGIPYAVSFAISLMFQLIPILVNEVGSIANAQRSRGFELDKGGLVERSKRYTSIAFPLIIRSITLGQNMSIALHVYRFKVGGQRTSHRELVLRTRDLCFLFCLVVFTALIVYLWNIWR